MTQQPVLTRPILHAGLLIMLLVAEPALSETVMGEWTTKGYDVAGTWVIDANAGTVTLSDDFKTRRGPDLKIFLSPLAAAEVDDESATEGSLLVSELESSKGGQSYELPEGIDLSDYKSILIHCEQYSKLWAAADLR